MIYLEDNDRKVFFKLYFDLLHCVNKKHNIVPECGEGRYPKSVDRQEASYVREKLFENPSWFDEYLAEYGCEINDEEIQIINEWRNFHQKGRFYVERYLKKYAILMSIEEEPVRLYGVVGLNHPFEELIHKSHLPLMIEATLLPFKGRIIYDGIIQIYNIHIGPNMRRNIKESYRGAKESFGIIEKLPFDEGTYVKSQKSTKKVATPTGKDEIERKCQEIEELMQAFCENVLNDEFIKPCFHTLQKLRRKRPTPLVKGKANTWACAIVYAVCSVNFVFDRAQPYYTPAGDIADGFGLSKSTAQNKGNEVKKLLKMSYFTPEYLIKSVGERSNSLLDMMRFLN